MSRERLFRVRSARSGGGRSRCRVVYRPAFRNMGQLFRPRAFRVAFPLSCAEYSGGRFCVLPRSGARLLFKESVESGESSRQGTTVRDALPPNRAGVSVRRHMFSCAGLTWRIPADSGLTGPFFRCHVRARDFAPAGCGSQSEAAHPVRTLARILAAGGGLVQGAERIGNSTVGTEKINEARKARRTYRAADTGM